MATSWLWGAGRLRRIPAQEPELLFRSGQRLAGRDLGIDNSNGRGSVTAPSFTCGATAIDLGPDHRTGRDAPQAMEKGRRRTLRAASGCAPEAAPMPDPACRAVKEVSVEVRAGREMSQWILEKVSSQAEACRQTVADIEQGLSWPGENMIAQVLAPLGAKATAARGSGSAGPDDRNVIVVGVA
jgi:hypothetical protein